MLQDPPTQAQPWEEMLAAEGVVACLFALAHAIRGANDDGTLSLHVPEDRHLGYVREYVANQLMGLAAFWRVQLYESTKR